MTLDLFVAIPVTDYAAALPWYEQFFGARPSFLPNDTEAAWQVAVIYRDADGKEINLGGSPG